MSWKHFNWLSGVILPVLAALMRVTWLVPWLELARRGLSPSASAPLAPAFLLVGFLLGSMMSARLFLTLVTGLLVARLGQTLAGFAAILLVIWWQFYPSPYVVWDVRWLKAMGSQFIAWQNELPPALVLLPILIYLWLRGTLDGQRWLDRDDIWNAFISGFLALTLAAIVAQLAGGGLPAGTGNLVFAYFALGMAALALASLESARDAASRRGEGRVAANRYWLASVMSVIASLLFIGLLLSILVSPDVIVRTLWWTSAILDILGRILFVVLLVMAYIIFALLHPLIAALRRAWANAPPSEPLRMEDIDRQLEEFLQGHAQLPAPLAAALPWLALAVVILVIALIFALALRRFRLHLEDGVGETRELILSRHLLAEQLARFWHRRFKAKKGATPSIFFLSLDGETEPRRRIRQVYQAFLQTMRSRGRPHQPSETPAEYQHELETTLSAPQQALGTMTDAYAEARYAATSPSPERAEAAQDAWQSIQQALTDDETGGDAEATDTPQGRTE